MAAAIPPNGTAFRLQSVEESVSRLQIQERDTHDGIVRLDEQVKGLRGSVDGLHSEITALGVKFDTSELAERDQKIRDQSLRTRERITVAIGIIALLIASVSAVTAILSVT